MQRFIICALSLFALASLAAEAADPARFRLTPALLERMDAVTAEIKGSRTGDSGKDDDEDADDRDDAESVEDIARKLEANPRIRAALARQGLGGLEYATAALAALHAGMVLAVEKAPGAQPGASLTPEQRSNVEVLRARNARPAR